MDGDVEGSALQRLGDVGPDGRRGPEERVEEEPERVRRAHQLVEGRPQGRVAHAAAARRRASPPTRVDERPAAAQPKTSTRPAPFVGSEAASGRRSSNPKPGRCARAWCGRLPRTDAGAHRHKTALAPERRRASRRSRRHTSNGACWRPRFVVEPEHGAFVLLDRHDQRGAATRRRGCRSPCGTAGGPGTQSSFSCMFRRILHGALRNAACQSSQTRRAVQKRALRAGDAASGAVACVQAAASCGNAARSRWIAVVASVAKKWSSAWLPASASSSAQFTARMDAIFYGLRHCPKPSNSGRSCPHGGIRKLATSFLRGIKNRHQTSPVRSVTASLPSPRERRRKKTTTVKSTVRPATWRRARRPARRRSGGPARPTIHL